MPNREDNDRIATFIVELGWFQSQTIDAMPSDNWRQVQDSDGRAAILYLELFHSSSVSGEPAHLPNNRETADGEGTLPKLLRLHRELPAPKTGPFLALAEVTAEGQIVNVRVWNVAGRLSDGVTGLPVQELLQPYRAFPRILSES